jgi:hypothetical protein
MSNRDPSRCFASSQTLLDAADHVSSGLPRICNVAVEFGFDACARFRDVLDHVLDGAGATIPWSDVEEYSYRVPCRTELLSRT